ncbi:protease modulator HflC [Hyphomonas sp. WL0036]|uniref:protease modulator HflC n=1 Tax=Hyphomonas sediminis TaxID=2866160 RepID=UPI001C817BF9|nr:protease modulator HflC [Hyphomonas sediminis]MBY9065555.1 protease modulator HflC [Hyphomonas sediminis]
MRAFGWLILILSIVGLVIASNVFFVVRQSQQAIVLEVGKPVRIINAPGTDEAGLHMKIPVYQQVEILDKRNLGLDIEGIQVIASDQRRLQVDAFVRWRINDPLRYYQSFRTESAATTQINTITVAAIRATLGDVPVPEIISGQRAALMNEIRESVNAELIKAGVDIIDVRIRQADLPQEVAEGVYNRMRTARLQEAQRIRSEGEERARLIRAQAEREKTVIEAQAREAAEKIRGEGDARATEVYANAYNKDAEFFRFQRALVACEKAIQEGTQLVVSPESIGVCDQFFDSARSAGGPR